MTFVGPASYTGEDSAELILPGNPDVVRRVLDDLTAHAGVRHAGPGEFSARAFLNGKLTLEQAEGVAATISARTAAELDAARALLAGTRGTHYLSLADRLTTLLALTEAGIDFTDQEDVVAISPADLARGIASLCSDIATDLGGPTAAESRQVVPSVVLAGSPNAGKSTLFNALLGRARAVVSPTAGTTRDILAEPLALADVGSGGTHVLLSDLAGIDSGPGVSAIDERARDVARQAIKDADVIIHCDPSGRFTPLGDTGQAHVIRVRTKGDLPAPRIGDHESIADRRVLPVCALDGWGLDALKRAIADGAWGAASTTSNAVLPRHRLALRRSLDGLRAAEAAIGSQVSRRSLTNPETVAASLRTGLDALEEIAGRISPDDVLGRVFATFCIGK
jgi:tRNA modification GTPase